MLVAELLRRRGPELLARTDLRVVIDRTFYVSYEHLAQRRVPHDPTDWPPVALALALDVGILTGDHDFLGCGCPTWTVDTLREELA